MMLENTYHGVEIWFLVRAASRLESCSLDLSPHHVLAKKRLASEEKLVIIPTSVGASSETVESIQVQLPLETCKFGLTEVIGHDVVCELLGHVDREASTMWLPRDNVCEPIGLN
jgi:hypothetical protein